MFCKHEIWLVPDLAILIGTEWGKWTIRCKACGKRRQVRGDKLRAINLAEAT